MSETLNEQKSPEQRVFGEAFSLGRGTAEEEKRNAYFEERIAAIAEGKTIWLSRTLDADRGVAADLYKDRKAVATLDFDYDTLATTVYTTSEGGEFGDTTLCEQVLFDDAVVEAEKFAESLT